MDYGQDKRILPRPGWSRRIDIPAKIKPQAAVSAAPGATPCNINANGQKLDLAAIVTDLNNLLRLKTTVIGMKLFARVEEMTAIPKSGGRAAVHTTDQIVSMASRLGWTVGITADDLVGAQCRAVIGLAPQDEKWLRAQTMSASGTAPRRTRASARRRSMSCRTATTRRWR